MVEKGVFSMSKWAREAVQKLREHEFQEDQKTEALVVRRKLLEEQGQGLWDQLCAHVEKLVGEFSKEYGSDAIEIFSVTSKELKARIGTRLMRRQVVVEFKMTSASDALKWRYEGDKANGDVCSLHINDAGVGIFQQAALPRTPESLAQEILDGLLQE
jgi:hypothetical protein